MDERTQDVLIVGGGVMGLGIAYELGRRGVAARVLERRHVGAGSSGKSGAILRQHYSHPLTASMARDSLRTFADFEGAVGASAGFVRTGMLLIVDARGREGLERNVEMQRSLAIRTELLDAEGLREAAPELAVGDEVGCFEAEAGYADPGSTLSALLAAVEREGGVVEEGVRVAGLEERNGRILARVGDRKVEADRIVVAAGAWTDPLLEGVGLSLPIEPRRVQSAVFGRPPGFGGGPVLIDFPNQMYAKHAAETHVGSIAPEETQRVEPDGYDEGVSDEYVRLAHERLTRRLPVMVRATRFGGYGALYGVTPDWHPAVGPVGEQLYVCAGFSGHGFKLAPAIATTVAAELVGAAPPYDLAPLRPERFQRDEHFRGSYSYSIMG